MMSLMFEGASLLVGLLGGDRGACKEVDSVTVNVKLWEMDMESNDERALLGGLGSVYD